MRSILQTEAIHNLSIANYHLGYFKEAAAGFSQVSGDPDFVQLNEVVALIKAGDVNTAEVILGKWNAEADNYVDALVTGIARGQTTSSVDCWLFFCSRGRV